VVIFIKDKWKNDFHCFLLVFFIYLREINKKD